MIVDRAGSMYIFNSPTVVNFRLPRRACSSQRMAARQCQEPAPGRRAIIVVEPCVRTSLAKLHSFFLRAIF